MRDTFIWGQSKVNKFVATRVSIFEWLSDWPREKSSKYPTLGLCHLKFSVLFTKSLKFLSFSLSPKKIICGEFWFRLTKEFHDIAFFFFFFFLWYQNICGCDHWSLQNSFISRSFLNNSCYNTFYLFLKHQCFLFFIYFSNKLLTSRISIDNFGIYWVSICLNLWEIVIILKIDALIVKY